MDTAGTAALPLSLDELVERQRHAILARDPSALEVANEALLAGIAALRAGAIGAAASTRSELLRVRTGLRTNAELLQRAQAGNARALSALFGSEPVYRHDGDGRPARASRPIESA